MCDRVEEGRGVSAPNPCTLQASTIYSFIHPKIFLSNYYMSGMILGAEDRLNNMNPYCHDAYILMEGRERVKNKRKAKYYLI